MKPCLVCETFFEPCTSGGGTQVYCSALCRGRAWWSRNPEYLRDRSGENPERRRDRVLRRLYGLTLEQYKQMLEQQGYVCAICKREDSLGNLSVDHDHETGKVRALLCRTCNRGLGLFHDDLGLLERAVQYVRLFQTETTSVKETQ